MIQYRRDVDGLRALAIGAVLLFHASPGRLPGGFIGVDVFFVISGYLISQIIFNGLEHGNFSFLDFFSRRIRRIAPALVLVLATCLAFGWFALLAEDYKHLGRNALSSAFFIINFDLLNEINYFDNAMDTKPLLHLWSLGVEAQFYIMWPVLVWLVWKLRINLLAVIIVTTLGSFALNLFETHKDALAAFYLPQTRFWELLLGSGLAWHGLYKKPGRAIIPGLGNKILTSDTLSAAGLLILCAGFFFISKDRLFPGMWALLPVLGTFFIILAGPDAWLNKHVFSNKVTVWVGLISYPLYLWHWPLLSFARLAESEIPSPKIRAGLLALSIILSWLTYRFIEIPIRNRNHSGKKTATLIVLLLITGYFGYSCYENEGYKQRSNASINGFYGNTGTLDWYQYMANKYYSCATKEVVFKALVWKGFIRCYQSKPGFDIQTVIVGDSHAEHLFIGFAEAFPEMNVVFYAKGTTPFVGNADYEEIFKAIQSNPRTKNIILSAYWIEKVTMVPSGSTLADEVIKIIDLLEKSGKKVYITDDVPAFNSGPEKCIIKRGEANNNPSCEIELEKYINQEKLYIDALIKAVRLRPRTKLIRLNNFFCDVKRCSMMIDNKVMYRDSNHLNIDGSRYIGQKIRQEYPNLFD